MTLKEIASRAGVSVSTVSRVINCPDDSFGSEEVRNRVWEIVRETNYIPNSSARKLKMGQPATENEAKKTLACIFGRTRTPSDNPFFVHLARTIEQQALQMGYAVACSYSVFDIHERHTVQAILNTPVDGAIVLGRFGSNTRSFLEKHYRNKIVYTGLNAIQMDWDQVICDGYAVAKTVMEYLFDLGHTRIGYIGEIEREARFTGYVDMLAERDIAYDSSLVSNYSQNGQGGYMGASKLIEQDTQLPTAVFCSNDSAAIGAMRRFSEQGLKIPRDINVISVDNIELAQFVSPMLTTVDVPKEELGRHAVRMLIDRLEKGHKLPMKLVLPHKLVIRESTGKAARPHKDKS